MSLDGPDDAPVSARFVCNWATTEAEVDAFLAALAEQKVAQGA
jgi:threonine aldolase